MFGVSSAEDGINGMAEPRLRLVVEGRVQGVGFRAWVLRRALELGLRGWVRNCRNGDVEIEASGSAEQLAELRGLLAAGPPLARVIRVREEPPLRSPLGEHFEIR
jgi:acylphosphatase